MAASRSRPDPSCAVRANGPRDLLQHHDGAGDAASPDGLPDLVDLCASVASSNVANFQLELVIGYWQHFHIGNIPLSSGSSSSGDRISYNEFRSDSMAVIVSINVSNVG